MNKIYPYFALFFFILSGCKYRINENSNLIQKIDNLDMVIYSNKGEKLYSIKSPESIYDKNENRFILKKTTINMFKNKKKEYIINSNESKLSNNKKVLELFGNVQLKTVFKDNDILKADKLFWNIDESKYLLKGNVSFENNDLILTSSKATLNSQNILKFHNPVKYIIKSENKSNNYEIHSENAFYDLTTKSVKFNANEKRVRTKIYF